MWGSNWILTKGGLRKPVSKVPNPNLVVKDLLNSERQWNKPLLRKIFNNNADVDNLLKIYIPGKEG